MTRDAWHIEREGPTLTLCRQRPARFDISAQTQFPICSRERLARQIRQDLWRELKHLRGYSPVVRIHAAGSELTVTAGGRALYPVPQDCEMRIRTVLEDPVRRLRWLRWAGKAAS